MVNKVKELKTPETALFISPVFFNLTFVYHYDRTLFSKIGSTSAYSEIQKGLINDNIYTVWSLSEADENVIRNADKIIYVDACATNDLSRLHGYDKKYPGYLAFRFPEIYNVYVFQKTVGQ